MTAQSIGAPLARALSDGADRLLQADEPLAGLHLRAGGELPGTIAVPALFEAVAKARRYGLKLARTIVAHDGTQPVRAWVEVSPRGGGQDGCEIVLRHWQAVSATSEPGDAETHRTEIDRDLADLVARLDAGQNVLAVEVEAADLKDIAAAMADDLGRPWTAFVEVAGGRHEQPLHWRLLDGAPVSVPGSPRPWRARLVPQGAPGADPAGFELLLVSDTPVAPAPPPSDTTRREAQRLVGREIAPVLRQPIARIIANAETIRTRMAGPLADSYADYAADIATAGEHLLGLLDDLADLEVVEADDFSTAPDRIDLADVARRAAGILAMRARERGIAIDAPREGERMPAVAEFRRVLQILLNLIGNAIRYAPANSQVWIRLDRDGSKVRAVVADQGPGLSDEQQARVFEKFERLGRSGDGGSGLGLYISRRLARAMGGDLTVESAPGQGARFAVELPAGPGDA